MRRIAWARAKAWLGVARFFKAFGRLTMWADASTLRVEKWAERRAAIAMTRAIGRDADALLARVREAGR